MLKRRLNILLILFLLVYSFGFSQGIEINTGASIVSVGNTSLEIDDGNFVNNGTFIRGTGTVIFTGTALANILGSSNNDFYKLTINNSNGLTLASTGYVAINHLLSFTSGLIHTNENILTLNDEATVIGNDSSHYVDGYCRKVGNDPFLFPIGNDGQYAPLSISAPSNVTDHYTASYYHQDPHNTYSVISLTGGLNNVSTNEYWMCERTNGVSGVNVQLHWENADLSGISDYTSDLVIAFWNGTAWDNCGNTAITASSTGDITSILTGTFGPFTFGSLSTEINILPISLISFSASLKGGGVELDWETSSEINNDYFEIERSQNSLNYERIGSVIGGGNSSLNRKYSFVDEIPLGGVSFYRLKQVDYDGVFINYPPKKINFKTSVLSLLAYPNPVEDYVNISYNISNGVYANSIGICDMYGQLILTRNISKVEDVLKLDITQLSPGSYIVALMLGSKFVNSTQLLVK